MVNIILNPNYVRSILNYNIATGELFWRVNRSNKIKDSLAGSISKKDGYCRVRIDNGSYLAHRLIWLIVGGEWPEGRLDHINRIKSDNRWCNLRECTNSQNLINANISKSNTSGYKGVVLRKNNQKWRSRITVNYKRISLGDFDTKEEAYDAYCTASRKYFSEFGVAAGGG